jgi:hypothetical protein
MWLWGLHRQLAADSRGMCMAALSLLPTCQSCSWRAQHCLITDTCCPLPPPRARHASCPTPCRIDNPAYKGIWVAPDIDNPEYKHDDKLYLQKDIKYVGFELWQVKAGTIFDNIMVTDSLEEAKKFAEDTWGKTKDAEKEMFDKIKEVSGDLVDYTQTGACSV